MPGTLPHAFSHDGTSAFHPFRKDNFSSYLFFNLHALGEISAEHAIGGR